MLANQVAIHGQSFQPADILGEAVLDGEDGQFDIAADAQLLEYTVTIAIDCLGTLFKVFRDLAHFLTVSQHL